DSHTDEIRAAGANTGKLTRQWLALMTGSFDAANITAKETGGQLILQQPQQSGTTMICEVDRKTLTPRRYILNDEKGASHSTLNLSRYIETSNTIFPRRIQAISDSGRILIDLRDLEINGEIPPAAFRPPKRAEKIQESGRTAQ